MSQRVGKRLLARSLAVLTSSFAGPVSDKAIFAFDAIEAARDLPQAHPTGDLRNSRLDLRVIVGCAFDLVSWADAVDDSMRFPVSLARIMPAF